MPNTDYTLGASSTARDTGINRRAKAALAAAETFTTAAALLGGPVPAETISEAWENALLYDEHTWGMAHPAGAAQAVCAAQKGLFAARAAALAEDALVKSANFLANRVALSEEDYYLVVFNPLDRPLTTCARAPAAPISPCSLPLYWKQSSGVPTLTHGNALGRDVISLPDEILEAPFDLVDMETGESVTYQIVRLLDPHHPSPYAAQRYSLAHTDPTSHASLNYTRGQAAELAFIARDLPACGYKTYAIRPGVPSEPSRTELACGENWLENRYYRLEVDPVSGAVTRLFDKLLPREWVDANAAYGVNQLVARYPATGEVRATGDSTVRVGERGPVFASLIIEGSGPGSPQRTQEIIVYADLKRVDFNNRLLRDSTPHLELLLAFPFSLQDPSFSYEASNTRVEPLRDQLPGSNTAAYTVQDWVCAQDAAGTLFWNTLEAPVVSLGGLWPSPISQAHHGATPPGFAAEFLRDPAQLACGHIFSYAAVSSFRTNFQPVQPGEMLFRYRLTTLPKGPANPLAANASWMASVEPFSAWVRGPQTGELGVSGSFCQVEGDGVILQAIKIADDGDGLVLRLRETAGRQARAQASLAWCEIDKACETNLVEEDQRELPCEPHLVQVKLEPYSLATIRLRVGRRWRGTERLFFG
jgi:hypothetical protein